MIREFNEIPASITFDEYDAADKRTKRRLRGLDFGELLYSSSFYTFLRGAGLDAKAEVHGLTAAGLIWRVPIWAGSG
ncbi:MAG: hypothetical protein LBP22_10580 [Deltaproteobacteria bacterium]|nr:hypothetical protein [Deltaproteobacteria bacterium]